MAIPIKKFAIECEKMAIVNGEITETSSSAVSLHEISRQWRALYKATAFKSLHFPNWSEKEESAAEVIIATLTYLQRIGCPDIEKLLKDKQEQHRRPKS